MLEPKALCALLSGKSEHFDTIHTVMTVDTMTKLKTCVKVKMVNEQRVVTN